MLTAYKKFWINYTNFSGRSSRPDYWWVYLLEVLVSLPVTFFFLANIFVPFIQAAPYLSSMGEEEATYFLFSIMFSPGNIFLWVLTTIYSLATIIPRLAIMVRRLRDAGFHWAWIFLGVIPYINLLGVWALIVLLAMPTKEVPADQPAPALEPVQPTSAEVVETSQAETPEAPAPAEAEPVALEEAEVTETAETDTPADRAILSDD